MTDNQRSQDNHTGNNRDELDLTDSSWDLEEEEWLDSNHPNSGADWAHEMRRKHQSYVDLLTQKIRMLEDERAQTQRIIEVIGEYEAGEQEYRRKSVERDEREKSITRNYMRIRSDLSRTRERRIGNAAAHAQSPVRQRRQGRERPRAPRHQQRYPSAS